MSKFNSSETFTLVFIVTIWASFSFRVYGTNLSVGFDIEYYGRAEGKEGN